MKSVRIHRAAEPLRDETVADPRPAEGEILVEIRAAGICHTDAHYRSDPGRAKLPVTPGHEIAGVVIECGAGVTKPSPGSRVGVHYLVSCGTCRECVSGGERFCAKASMFGKERDGGYAERVVVPAGNAVTIPDSVPLESAAVMMCSTATALHALRLGGLEAGQSVLVVGFGGLGVSALQLARVLGAKRVIAADVVAEKLEAARALGAETLDASRGAMEQGVRELTEGRGVDIALDFAGGPASRTAALGSLAPGGRLVLVALDDRPFSFDPYRDVLAKERRIVGCSDHLFEDLVELMELARMKKIDLSSAVTRTVPLEASAINAVLDELETGTSHLRTVILPCG
jgi:propanol-preferring alcohol dehydrogenase